VKQKPVEVLPDKPLVEAHTPIETFFLNI